MQRHDVASTLRRRCINVMCLLGKAQMSVCIVWPGISCPDYRHTVKYTDTQKLPGWDYEDARADLGRLCSNYFSHAAHENIRPFNKRILSFRDDWYNYKQMGKICTRLVTESEKSRYDSIGLGLHCLQRLIFVYVEMEGLQTNIFSYRSNEKLCHTSHARTTPNFYCR